MSTGLEGAPPPPVPAGARPNRPLTKPTRVDTTPVSRVATAAATGVADNDWCDAGVTEDATAAAVCTFDTGAATDATELWPPDDVAAATSTLFNPAPSRGTGPDAVAERPAGVLGTTGVRRDDDFERGTASAADRTLDDGRDAALGRCGPDTAGVDDGEGAPLR